MKRNYRCLLLAFWFTPLVACGQKTPETEADFASARKRMVATQLASRGIKEKRVLDSMRDVPRHKFVPAKVRKLAYVDHPLPIGHEQTISQPFIVAFMTEALRTDPSDRVLEIGTGSGYQAAVLSKLVKEVYSIEIVKELGETAKRVLQEEGFKNVHVRIGDGYKGWPEKAPFDAIIVTCAPEKIPTPLVEQLKDGGRMVIPVGKRDGHQELYLLEKKAGKMRQKSILPVRFVPMTGTAEEEAKSSSRALKETEP